MSIMEKARHDDVSRIVTKDIEEIYLDGTDWTRERRDATALGWTLSMHCIWEWWWNHLLAFLSYALLAGAVHSLSVYVLGSLLSWTFRIS
jgi:hypothetical protein